MLSATGRREVTSNMSGYFSFWYLMAESAQALCSGTVSEPT